MFTEQYLDFTFQAKGSGILHDAGAKAVGFGPKGMWLWEIHGHEEPSAAEQHESVFFLSKKKGWGKVVNSVHLQCFVLKLCMHGCAVSLKH